MTQNEPDEIVAFSTEAQQILVQAQRQIDFTAVRVIAEQSERSLNKLRQKRSSRSTASVPAHRHGLFPARPGL